MPSVMAIRRTNALFETEVLGSANFAIARNATPNE